MALTDIYAPSPDGRHVAPAPLGVLREIEHGVPVSALDAVARAVAPDDSAFAFRIVPKATLSRRRKAAGQNGGAKAVLPPDEGARVARVAEVWAAALDVWRSAEDARDFLFRKHPLLGGQRPMDLVLANEYGRPVVLDILGGLKYGTAV